MKKRFMMLLSMAVLLSAGFAMTSCGDDDDDDSKSEIKESATNGKTDGETFAADYAAVKEAYTTSGATGAATALLTKGSEMKTLLTNYKNSDDKTYKASFLSAASGATGLAEDKIESLAGSDYAELATALINLFNN